MKDTPMWRIWTFISFFGSVIMTIAGIWYLLPDPILKGAFTMAILYIIQASIAVTKVIRDLYEERKSKQRLDEAKRNPGTNDST